MSEEQQEVVVPGPGEILKKAREAANLSTQDIASKVRLKNTLIEELEQDNYDINISLTFIKGYLKLYAKQVNVSESEIVDAFEKHNTQKKEPAKLQSFSRKFSHQANDDKLMLVTYLIVAVVIALVVVWWFQQSDGENKVSSFLSSPATTVEQKVETKPETLSETQQEEPQAIIPVDATESDNLESNLLDNDAPVNQVNESAAIEDLEPQAESGVPNESLNPQDASEVSEVESVSQELTNEASTLDASATEDVPVNQAEPVELVFEFSDNCWMNLADATGENIAFGVKTKGRVMPITGIPPFVVTLGAPEVVKISYAGDAVDMSFIVPGRSAKFELPLTE
ncbi:RodZ domain-containing protein [Paraglaciecola sp.]|uniref:RodZ domain-containing protein n=1 Tax=Paraglaciecola sp. TaxID=1920173 RepID=UPI003EF6A56D